MAVTSGTLWPVCCRTPKGPAPWWFHQTQIQVLQITDVIKVPSQWALKKNEITHVGPAQSDKPFKGKNFIWTPKGKAERFRAHTVKSSLNLVPPCPPLLSKARGCCLGRGCSVARPRD